MFSNLKISNEIWLFVYWINKTNLLLKNNIVTIGNVDNLVESKKISIDNYLELKDKYKEEYND